MHPIDRGRLLSLLSLSSSTSSSSSSSSSSSPTSAAAEKEQKSSHHRSSSSTEYSAHHHDFFGVSCRRVETSTAAASRGHKCLPILLVSALLLVWQPRPVESSLVGTVRTMRRVRPLPLSFQPPPPSRSLWPGGRQSAAIAGRLLLEPLFGDGGRRVVVGHVPSTPVSGSGRGRGMGIRSDGGGPGLGAPPPPSPPRPHHPLAASALFSPRSMTTRFYLASATSSSSSSSSSKGRSVSSSSTTTASSSTGDDDDDGEEEGEDDRSLYEELLSVSSALRSHDVAYYSPGSQPTISDDEYDALARREARICTDRPDLLRRLEDETGLGSTATRYGGRVGPIVVEADQGRQVDDGKEARVSSSGGVTATVNRQRIKRTHMRPMLSLDNVSTEEDAVGWIERVRRLLLKHRDESLGEEKGGGGRVNFTVFAEPKMDGLSLALRYELVEVDEDAGADDHYYSLVWGATRGNGRIGEDVTDAASRARGVPASFRIGARDLHGGADPSPSSSSSSSPPPPPPPRTIEVRGEVVLPTSAFERYRSRGGDEEARPADGEGARSKPPAFSNARNAASGILQRRKADVDEHEEAKTDLLRSELVFYAYDVVLDGGGDGVVGGGRALEARRTLERWGFRVPQPVAMCEVPLLLLDNPPPTVDGVVADGAEEEADEAVGAVTDEEVLRGSMAGLFSYHRALMASRDGRHPVEQSASSPFSSETTGSTTVEDFDLDYEVDGAVYKLDDLVDRTLCGYSARAPRWAVAHKFPPKQAVTRVVGLEVNVGRTGALTPVAILEPVEIGGTLVTRASLHNFNYAAKVLLDDDDAQQHAAKTSSPSNSSEETTRPPPSAPATRRSVRVGTYVTVSRAGDVIPQVVRRLTLEDEEGGQHDHDAASLPPTATATGGGSGEDDVVEWISLEPPTKCPSCGSDTVFEPVYVPKRKKTKEVVVRLEDDGDGDGDGDGGDELIAEGSSGGPGHDEGDHGVGNQDAPNDEAVAEIDARCVSPAEADEESSNSTVVTDEDDNTTGRVLRCAGPKFGCEPRAIGSLSHAFSRDALDVTGLSEARVAQLRDAVIIERPSDVFLLAEDVQGTKAGKERAKAMLDEIANLPGWGAKSAGNLASAAKRVVTNGVPLDRYIYSLGIRHVGLHSSRLIARAYGSAEEFLSALRDAASFWEESAKNPFARLVGGDDEEEDEDDGGVSGVGPVLISSLLDFARDEAELDSAVELSKAVPILDDRTQRSVSSSNESSGPLAGLTVVFTGSVPGMTRTSAKALARVMGAKSTPGSLSSTTDIVIEGERGGKKALQAREKGISVLNATEFIDMAEGYR